MNEGNRLMHGEGIVCLSSIDWDFIWQGHQEIMHRLAEAGNPVLFIENTGVRTPNFSDFPRLMARLRNWGKGPQGFREQEPNLIVLSPILLPFPYSRVACWINAWLLARAIKKWMSATKRNAPILWTFLPTPLVNAIITELEPSLVIYYCIDHFAASSSAAQAVVASETELFRKADIVFVTSVGLQKRACQFREAAHIFPFGIDFKLFEDFRRGGLKEPADIARIAHPRLGYIGGVHRWVDLELIRKAALNRPDYQFVLVGPEQTDTARLRDLPNVHLLGSRSHDTLPAYIGSFDAGLIPYRLTEYTRSVYPTKLNEYFAMGIPVISTALPEVLAYNETHKNVVVIAEGADHLISQISESLRTASAGREARIDAARRNGWSERVYAMSDLMSGFLAKRRAEPIIMAGLLRRLAQRHKRSTVITALALAIALGILRWTPLAWRLGEFLRLTQPPIAADAIVVIAGGAGESGEVGQGHEERVSRAIQLYRQGFADKIVLCSGNRRTFSELEVMRAIALTKNVRDADILLEPRGGGTHSMIASADLVIRSKAWKRILLVSSPYHMKRAVLTWKKLSPELEVVPTPIERSRFYRYSAAKALDNDRPGPNWAQLHGLLQETAAFAYYRYWGWI